MSFSRQAASVSLPTLQYYFGSKEGMYLACAEAIIAQYRSNTTAAAEAAEALRTGCEAETARTHLKAVIGALAASAIFLQPQKSDCHDETRPIASICAFRRDRTIASSSCPMVVHCIARNDMLRPD